MASSKLSPAVAILAGTLLLPATAFAEDPCAGDDAPSGCFYDLDERWKSPSILYDERLDAMDPFHLMTLSGEALFLGAGIVWYAVDDERNLADWDYPSWKQRFTLEAWRFDNNHFPINFMGHTLSGAAYYAFPRANDHGVLVSTAYSFMTSFVWEFFVEFREKVSVNDLLVTTSAGMPIGEFANKLWRYFTGIPPDASTGRHVFAAIAGFPVYTRRAIAGQPQTTDGPYDALGFSNHISPDLRAGYQVRLHDYGERVTTHGARIGGRLSSIPGEGRPGAFSLFFYQADIVDLWLSAAVGNRAREWELSSDVHLLGLYDQTLDAARDGHQTVVAMTLGYRYRFDDFYRYNDRLGILHLPGSGFDFRYTAGDAQLSAYHRLHGDFAGLHAAAYSGWANEVIGPEDRDKTILRKHNYYYAWGVSSRFGGRLSIGPLDLGASAAIGVYDSIEGLDRQQENLTIDPDATDRVLELEAQVGFTVPDTKVRLGAGWSSTERRSRVEHVIVDTNLETWTLGVSAGL